MGLVFIDCEAWGGCPALGQLTEFGAVAYETRETFHGILVPDRHNPANRRRLTDDEMRATMVEFDRWLQTHTMGRAIMVSDNPAFDFMWLADACLRTLGYNPFGHSGRRIGDFYAGLTGDFRNSSRWKRLRITRHSHVPTEDALGNLEAFERILRGER